MELRKKKRLALGMALLTMLVLTACKPYFPEEYQVANTDGEISNFGLNIAPADTMGDWVVEWVSGVSGGDGFQYFVYSDPDSWDVYLYFPSKNAEVQALTNEDIAVDYADSVLKVYVEGGEAAAVEKDAAWVLHFAAQPLGAWPSEVELYWDGAEIICDAVHTSV